MKTPVTATRIVFWAWLTFVLIVIIVVVRDTLFSLFGGHQ